jgi:hypothetical protein
MHTSKLTELLEKRHTANIAVTIFRVNVLVCGSESRDVDLAVVGETEGNQRFDETKEWGAIQYEANTRLKKVIALTVLASSNHAFTSHSLTTARYI